MNIFTAFENMLKGLEPEVAPVLLSTALGIATGQKFTGAAIATSIVNVAQQAVAANPAAEPAALTSSLVGQTNAVLGKVQQQVAGTKAEPSALETNLADLLIEPLIGKTVDWAIKQTGVGAIQQQQQSGAQQGSNPAVGSVVGASEEVSADNSSSNNDNNQGNG